MKANILKRARELMESKIKEALLKRVGDQVEFLKLRLAEKKTEQEKLDEYDRVMEEVKTRSLVYKMKNNR